MIPRNDSCFVPVRFDSLVQEHQAGGTPVANAPGSPPKNGDPGSPLKNDAHGSETEPVSGAPGSETNAPETRYPMAKSVAELEALGEVKRKWLWHGYLAAGSVTLLTSMWKSGKTTLVSVLLARMKTGGTLAGRAVAAGRAVVISEEDLSMWAYRNQTLEFGPNVCWYCRPFMGRPSLEDWQALLDQIAREHEREPVDLLVVDPLAYLSPLRSENEASEMLKTLGPLQTLASRGMSVLILHHPKKGETRPGQAARGSGALQGFGDIILEMERVSRNMQDSRRRLPAFSRYVETPPKWIIEMTPDGCDFLGLGETAQPSFENGWPLLNRILKEAESPLSLKQIRWRWPKRSGVPSKATIHRWLDRLLEGREVIREGRGTWKNPYVYLLPGMELERQEEMLSSLAGQPEVGRRRKRVED